MFIPTFRETHAMYIITQERDPVATVTHINIFSANMDNLNEVDDLQHQAHELSAGPETAIVPGTNH